MAIVNINNDNFEKEVLKNNNNKIIIVDFWAEWCNPCKMISKELNKINEELLDEIKICKINIDIEKNLATNFLIKSIPTLIFYLNGVELKRITGFNNKNKILSIIKQYQNQISI